MEKITERLVELNSEELRLLEWLGEWTPEVHRADWQVRRAWPPGYREVADTSVPYAGHGRDSDEEKRARQSVPPMKNALRLLPRLCAYRLVEGHPYTHVVRLTRRGRAALLYSGFTASEVFKSHTEVYDDVDLRPVVEHGMFEVGSLEAREFSLGASLPDTKEIWEILLREYREEEQPGNRNFNDPHAKLSICSGERYLRGSLRKHHEYINVEVQNASGMTVCEFALSLEGLTELLVSRRSVPVTLDYYRDHEGMAQHEPACPPFSMMERMQARIENSETAKDARLQELRNKIESANMGKKLKEELLNTLDIATRRSDVAFRVEQAVEEISAVVESAFTIMNSRVSGPSLPERSSVREIVGLPGLTEGEAIEEVKSGRT